MKQLRERVACYGAQNLSSQELLQVILGTGVGNKASPEHIVRLVGDDPLPSLLSLDYGQIASTLGPVKATQVAALLELTRRLMRPVEDTLVRIATPADAANLVMADLSYLDHEEMRVLLLNTKNQVVGNIRCYQGTISSTCVRAAELMRPAVTRQCAGIIVCHNHPSGDTTPSPEDIAFTEQCVEAGKLLDIEVVDHLIIGNWRFASLKERLRW